MVVVLDGAKGSAVVVEEEEEEVMSVFEEVLGEMSVRGWEKEVEVEVEEDLEGEDIFVIEDMQWSCSWSSKQTVTRKLRVFVAKLRVAAWRW